MFYHSTVEHKPNADLAIIYPDIATVSDRLLKISINMELKIKT